MALALSAAAPIGASKPNGPSAFPLAGLLRELRAAVAQGMAWASDRPATPVQERGGGHGDGTATTAATTANGGNGRAPGKTPGALDEAEPPKPQARTEWTTPAQSGFDPVTSRRIAQDATATSDIYENTDGSHTRIVSTAPLNYRDVDGTWKKIDSRLVRDSSGRWRVAANSVGISLAGFSAEQRRMQGAEGARIGGTELARMTLPSGQSIGWTLSGAALPDPVVSGSKATYADVLPSTDVVLDTFHSGVKETLVLWAADAPSSWLFELDSRGLTAVIDENGGVALKDTSGQTVARIPPGYMEDSNVDAHSGDGKESTKVAYELTSVNGRQALRVTADRAWLSSPDRVWPVRLDPTNVTTNASAFVSNYYSNTDTSGHQELKIGQAPGESPAMFAQGLLKFDAFSSTYLNQRITNSWIKFQVFWTGACPGSAAATFHIKEITSAWTAPGVRWGNKPSLSSGDDVAGGPGSPSAAVCNANDDPNSPNAWWSYSMNNAEGMKVLNGWTGGTRPNHGLALTTSFGPAQDWVKVSSVNTNFAPYLQIEYTPNVAPVVNTQYPQHGYASPTLTPELLVKATDPDAFPKALTYQFQVFDPASPTPTTPIADSGWIASRSYRVPPAKLSWSKPYLWTALASDGALLSSMQGMNLLTTTVPQAPITSGLSQNADQGFSAQVGNYTASNVDAQVPGVGPPLAVSRSYNSRDARTGQAFGLGWSSIVDAKAAELTDPGTSTPRAVTITYPNGQDVTFGRHNDGTFAPPSGRFSTLRTVTGGYDLTDKEGTKYAFTVLKSAGVYGLTAVTDSAGRTLTMTYTAGKLTAMTGASGRQLTLTWSGSNVSSVANQAGDTWAYTYTGGTLTKVCTPTSATACHTYQYGANSLHPTAVLDAQPHTYWRMNEAAGAPVAQSSVLDNTDTATATYTNVTLGAAGPLPAAAGWTPPTAAGFNGTNAYVNFSQPKVAMSASVQSVSLWFKTSGSGVLLSYQDRPVVDTSATAWSPALYVGVDGKLRGELWQGAVAPMTSATAVNNNAWHHVALVAAGTEQQMWLDGNPVAATPLAGVPDVSWTTDMHLGAGKWSLWPSTSGTVGYFSGSLAEFAFYDRPLSGAQVKTIYDAGVAVAKPLTRITRPTGGITAIVEYDAVSGLVKKVTDNHNGVWTINPPTVSGSSAVHTSTVLAAAPSDYFRLVDTDNEVNGNSATFSNVTFNSAAGPLGDTAASMAGSNNGVTLAGPSVDTSRSFSVSAWVYLPAGATTDKGILSINGVNSYSTLLYYDHDSAGTNHRFRFKVCGQDVADDTSCQWATTTSVPAQPDTWTHVVGVYDTAAGKMYLYLDGQSVATATVTAGVFAATVDTTIGRWRRNGSLAGSWNGRLAEVATYRQALTPEQVKAQYEARDKAGGGVPVKTVTVTDPGAKNTSHVYDLGSGRQVRQVDVRGGITGFGYDAGGFLRTTTDPNGNMTVEEHDVRGNVIAKTTCQDRSESKCSTVYTEYFPDATTKVLTPDPRNDLPLTVRDGRSASASDNTYLTTNTYDTSGNLTQVAEPLGRSTHTVYTTAGQYIAHDHTGLSGSGRYVRILGTARGTGTFYYLRDVQIYGPTGGDLALNRTATASSAQSSFPASHSADRSPITGWRSVAGSDAEWIHWDLGATKTIGRIRLSWGPDYGSGYQIQTSADAVAWTTIKTVTGAGGTAVPAGLPMRTIAPNGAMNLVYYNTSGDVVRTLAQSGLETLYGYNAIGRITGKTEISEAGSLVTTYAYDKVGRMVTQTDPAVLNRVTGASHAAVTTTGYDADGNVLSQSISDSTGGDATRTISSSYNTLGQLVSTTDAANKTRTFTYDLYGNKVTETDASSTQMAYEYDATGQLTKTTIKAWTGDPNNPTAPADQVLESRAYDPAGRLALVTDAMGWQTLYTYTDNGLIATVTRKNPAGGATFAAESNVYDAAGNLIRQTTNNGATATDMAYDAASRVTSQTVDPSGVNRTTGFTYNAAGQVTSTILSSGGTAQARADVMYDMAGNPLAQSAYTASGPTPVARWRFNETTGTTAAASAGNQAAILTNVTWTNDPVRGQVATFNGTSATARLNDPAVDTTRAFTIAAWVKMTSKADDQCVFAMAGEIGASAIKLCYRTAGDVWRVELSGRRSDQTSGWNNLDSTPGAPVANAWTHLAVTADPATNAVTLYVNGSSNAAMTATVPLNNQATHMQIGSEYGQLWLGGSISDFQMYPDGLPPSQISALHAGTIPAAAASSIRTSQKVDDRGLAVSSRDAKGNVTDYQYDEAGQVALTTSPTVAAEENGGAPVNARAVSTLGYNTFGEPVEVKDAKGRVTTTIRDAIGQAVEVRSPSYTPPGSSTPINPVARTEYYPTGQVLKTIDPLLHETLYVYDQLGRLAKTTAPNSGVSKYTYTLNGERLSVTDPNGGRSEATYDYLGRKLTTTQIERTPAAAFVTTYGYTAAGLLGSVTPPGRNATVYDYNAVGENTKVTDAAGNITQFQYDFAGRRTVSIEADNAKQTVAYDFAGRPVSQQRLDPAGAVLATTARAYDPAGNVVSTTDARGNTLSYAYDATGLVTQMVEPVSASGSITTSYGYDITGRPTRFTDGRNNRFLTTYNSWGLVESAVEPDGAAFTTAYDAAGQAASRTEPGGVSVTNDYNSIGRLVGQTGTGADASTADRGFGYDLGGRLTSFSEGGAGTTLSYNDRGQLTSTSGAAGASAFTWTGDGLMASRQDASGTASYTHDNAGRLATVGNPLTGESSTHAYNNLNQLTSITYGTSGNKRDFGYDPMRRLASDTLKTPGGATIASMAYGYDVNGNLTSKTTAGFAGAAANTYTYDKANRLLSWNDGAATTTYDYDASGNRTRIGARTLIYDSRNRLESDGNATYSYSDRGTLTGTTEGTVTTASTFDAYWQQKTQGTLTFAYDGGGRVLSTSSGVAFSYSGTGNDPASDGTALFSRGPGGSLTGVKQGTGAGVWAWTDLHTDVVGQFTSGGGTLAGSRTYSPLGTVVGAAGMLGNLGFQSGWTDPGSGKVNMHSRWYNPANGQFASRDTLSASPRPMSVRANRYAYGDGNPLTAVDPTGHCAFCSWVGNTVSSGAKAVASTVTSVATTVWNTTKSVASSAWNTLSSAYNYAYNWVSEKVDQFKNLALRAIHNVKNWAVQTFNNTMERAKQVYNRAMQVAAQAKQAIIQGAKRAVAATVAAAKATVEAGKKAAVAYATAIQDAYKASANWIAEHKAEILGFVAGAVVGIGCGALIGWTGVGAVACGALAGAAGSLVTGLIQGKRGWDLASDVLIGAAGGALGGGIGSFVGGKVAGMVAGKLGGGLFSRVGGGMLAGGLSGGASGAIEGAAGGAMGYGAQCMRAGSCTTGGFLGAAKNGAIEGAKWGALGGGIFGGAGGFKTPRCGHSFSANTKVLLATGAAVAIAAVTLGDKVIATDPETGRSEPKPVTLRHVNRDADLTDLTVTVHKGQKAEKDVTLKTTQHHPFWDATDGRWVDAADLKPGHKLSIYDDTRQQLEGDSDLSARATVTAVRNYAGLETMYDLTVADTHTYHVFAGDTPVLVHNCGGTQTAPSGQPHSVKCECANGANPRIVRNTGGMRGDTATRTQDIGLQFDIMDANPDWVHTGGGTRSQVGVRSPSGQIKYPDLTFENEMGESVYYQTADTNPDGTFKDREIENAEFLERWGSGQVIMVPKL